MIWYALIYSFLLAVFLSVIFSSLLENKGPWEHSGVFISILFFSMAGLILWTEPIGPIFYGVAWLELLFFGLFIALLLGASSEAAFYREKRLPLDEGDASAEAQAKSGTKPGLSAFGYLFWIMFFTLLGVFIFGLIGWLM